jgi:hypothetical protein
MCQATLPGMYCQSLEAKMLNQIARETLSDCKMNFSRILPCNRNLNLVVCLKAPPVPCHPLLCQCLSSPQSDRGDQLSIIKQIQFLNHFIS